ncbi:hypothetical protein V8E55_004013 [Tylopilus felleus]
MLDTPRLSASLKSSTDSSPWTPLSINQFILQSPSCKRPNDDKELESFKMESPESPPQTTFNPTLPWLQKMQKMYTPYKLRTSTRPLELQFAMRSLGRTSHTSLTLEDVIEGKEILKTGLSQLPNGLFNKFYISKLTSREYILSRLSTSLHQIDALEKMKDVLLEISRHDRDQLAAASKELEAFKEVAQIRCSDVESDIAYRNAVYADELAALTVTDTQLSQILSHSTGKCATSESELDSDISDDLVYEDDDDGYSHGSHDKDESDKDESDDSESLP